MNVSAWIDDDGRLRRVTWTRLPQRNRRTTPAHRRSTPTVLRSLRKGLNRRAIHVQSLAHRHLAIAPVRSSTDALLRLDGSAPHRVRERRQASHRPSDAVSPRVMPIPPRPATAQPSRSKPRLRVA